MIIKELSKIFGSKTKAQEILLLLKNEKKAVRQGFFDEELPIIKDFCKKNNLYMTKSPYKVMLLDKKNNFSNKGMKIPSSDKRRGMYFTYISKEKSLAQKAAFYEYKEDHLELGLILGYPPCCIKYFIEKFSEKNTNPEYPPSNIFTNISKRHLDKTIISHFPCSSECKRSIEIAKRYLKTIEEHDKEHARELKNSLLTKKEI